MSPSLGSKNRGGQEGPCMRVAGTNRERGRPPTGSADGVNGAPRNLSPQCAAFRRPRSRCSLVLDRVRVYQGGVSAYPAADRAVHVAERSEAGVLTGEVDSVLRR